MAIDYARCTHRSTQYKYHLAQLKAFYADQIGFEPDQMEPAVIREMAKQSTAAAIVAAKVLVASEQATRPKPARKPRKVSSVEKARKAEASRKQMLADAIANGPPGFSSIVVTPR